MAENTSIEWCDHTWSPVWGCTQVSKAETGGGGCDNCYAMNLAHRFGTGWNGAPMREFGEHHWNEPVRWNRRAAARGTRPKVFPSMCDPLDKDWPDAVRERFWRLVDATPYLTWLILTKRIGNAARLGPGAVIGRWPANVWLGATVVNQAEADRDIPKLLAVPARVRFLSIEPLLGPIDLTRIEVHGGDAEIYPLKGTTCCVNDEGEPAEDVPAIDWVIVGGESGTKARPMQPDWARSLRDQCEAARVPFLFKQWGEWAEEDTGLPDPLVAREGDPEFDSEIARHDGFLSLDGHFVTDPDEMVDGVPYRGLMRPGKKAAGRLLDGIEHNGFPEAR